MSTSEEIGRVLAPLTGAALTGIGGNIAGIVINEMLNENRSINSAISKPKKPKNKLLGIL